MRFIAFIPKGNEHTSQPCKGKTARHALATLGMVALKVNQAYGVKYFATERGKVAIVRCNRFAN